MLKLKFGSEALRVAVAKVEVPGIREPVGIRMDTTDEPTFHQVFIGREYDIALPITPRFIIDAGANVGYTAILFANRYPDAKIVAIEPDRGNFKFLCENVAEYSNVKPLLAGVWPRPGHLRLVTHDGSGKFLGQWGFQVEELSAPDERSVPAVTMGQVFRDSGHAVIDVLKLDVEGAEKEIFAEGHEEWLPRTNILMLEFHDRFKPGCSQSAFQVIRPEDFHHAEKGQTLIFTRKRLIE